MPEPLRITVNGELHTVSPGTTIAAAVLMAGHALRLSVNGEPRAPLCGMGVCYECRATVDGIAHQRTCQTPCRDGMVVTAAC